MDESKEDSELYDVDLKSKEEILNQDFPNYVKSMCNKLTNVHGWLENLIQNNDMFLTTYKVKPKLLSMYRTRAMLDRGFYCFMACFSLVFHLKNKIKLI